MEAWQVAQAGELEWHKENQWRADDDLFKRDTDALMRGFGFSEDDYKTVIDVGAGPRLRSRFFNAVITAIEPLAEQYKQFSWCDLDNVYAVPIEEFIPDLQADFVMCLNCLDHCKDFDKAIENMAKYAPKLFLSYDCGDNDPDPLHPLRLDEAISEATFAKHGLTVEKKSKTDPYRKGYALNYWLRRK